MQKGARVLTEERRRYIVNVLDRQGKVIASDLSQQLNVSDDTIRRDLRDLAEAGLLMRVHGGALPRSQSDPQYEVRETESPEAKSAIAVMAARLVQPGQVVILDAGTTATQIAHHFPRSLRATVITNSPPVAVALAHHDGIEVVMVGGELYKPSLANVGGAAIRALDAIRADICFLGVAGIHPEAGVSILTHEEVFVKRAMIDGASSVVAAATREKLGTAARYVVGPVSDLTHIVTEREVPAEALAPYRERGISICLG
jgi:DeoR/GlpR family transcriptional regulator of sugar metabolism